MKLFVSNKNESVRMFKNDFLESLTHIHPATPLVVFIPVILYFSYLALTSHPVYVSLPLILAGILFWTFLEYTMHRFAFHYQAKSKIGKRFHFMVHGVHHDFPRDGTRLVMPLAVSIPLAVLFYYLFSYAFAPYNNALFAGLVTGYLAYDCLHYAFHHFPMRSRVGTYLRIYHLRHHYNDPDSAYGVSTPLWDVIFRTQPKAVSEDVIKEWPKAA